ncbi:phosphate transport system regulatory protein PhoU [Actinoplanes sp. TRM 88003]|uniref:Phosphate transport system regulatory protein PhoU n=1 Tax=Paractinoplanes aksuensis TaxID=2939490 RepID=A0ABT1DM92_9ACTN|nr:PhoU domain-containing protein [Actinoplanes aksuensis]MCO8271633.1 phosphate transport system regulatory protein PhoU [Actinoplanes aksuensis]
MIDGTLVTLAQAAREAMRQASAALIASDPTLAQQVTVRDAEIDVLARVLDDRVYELVAQQHPDGDDARRLLSALRVGAHLERMGDLAVHVARATLRRHPVPAAAAELAGILGQMGAAADDLAGKVVAALADRDTELAGRLDKDDDAMDELHRRLFTVMLSPEWPLGVEAAIDGALLGRFYERYADHAVDIGRHVLRLYGDGSKLAE